MANILVETFEIEEVTTAGVPDEAAAIELAATLGLEGQMGLAKGETRRPYPEMTVQQKLVYEELFPVATPVAEYAHGIIPLRVLQVISHARACEMFEAGIYVWHSRVVPQTDPVLIGRKGKDYAWKYYLLARWGEALAPFEQLLAAAKVAMRARFKAHWEKEAAAAAASLSMLDSMVERKLAGDYIGI